MKSYSLLCFFLLACIIINNASSKSQTQDSYTKHCSSIIPLHNLTTRTNDDSSSLPFLSTVHFTGGHRFLSTELGPTYYDMQKNIRLRLRRDHSFKTTAAAVYEVQGVLLIRFPSTTDAPSKRARAPLTFSVKGFWSEKSSKLCMVGSATWKGIDFDAVLKLKFNEENPTIYTSVVSGSLESISTPDDPAFFDPISIFSFPQLPNYNYSLVPKQLGGGRLPAPDESMSLDANELCLVVTQGLRSLTLEYAAECNGGHCSPLVSGSGVELLHDSLFFTSIQCHDSAQKARFMATFSNFTSYGYNEIIMGSTVIGEIRWDEKNNRMIGVGCRILNPSLHFGNVVQDCTMMLSFRYPSVLTLTNDARFTGLIWSSKAVEDPGYFREISVSSNVEEYQLPNLPEQEYEYTEVERARKWCSTTNKDTKKGNVYPDGKSYGMRFDLTIERGKGQACFTPFRVDNDTFPNEGDMLYASPPVAPSAVLEPRMMSYRIKIYPAFSHLDWPVKDPHNVIDITAEGLYDPRNGHLCMVACRKLIHNSKDCEVVVELELPQSSGEQGFRAKGYLRSTRPVTDPLYFDDVVMESSGYNRGEAERTIRRMDVEILMVLISNALLCVFIALQIFHVKKNTEVPSSLSLVMIVILSVGHTIPLVLNYEALFSGDRKILQLQSGGRLEANEVAVRVITLVTLMLQLRLLQLVYTAKQRKGEKKAGFVSLALYILGGLIALVLNWIRRPYGMWRYHMWEDLKSYGGVILDGFLLPQILVNMFGGLGLGEKAALCKPFYIGTSMVRLMPHAYDQYRSHNYPMYDLNGTYYYANPAIDLYSAAWDILIPCGIIAFAVIVFVHQRHGGRCILPRRSTSSEMYENAPKLTTVEEYHYAQ